MTESTERAPAGLLLILTAAALWALIGVFTTPLLESGVTAREIAFWRAAVAGLAFLVHGAAARQLVTPTRGQLLPLVGFGLVGVAVFYVTLPAAIEAGGIGLAFVLLYTAPAWVAVAERLLGTRLPLRRWVLVAVTVVGAALVSQGQVSVTWAAVGWGLAAGLTYASWYVVGGRLAEPFGAVAFSAIVMPIGALALLPFIGFGHSLRDWALLIAIGLVSTYLPVLAYFTGLRHVETTRAAIVATIEPVIAVGLGVAIFDDRLTLIAVVGGLLVIGAAALSARTAST